MPAKVGKLPLVQVFRGCAALMVVLFHTTGLSSAKFEGFSFYGNSFFPGSVGVDFFFVLSGFIIYLIHHSDFGKYGQLNYFLRKRFVRVYPVYWLVMLFIVPVYFVVPSFGVGYERELSVILSSFILFPQSNSPVLTVAWTLSYEVLFYLLFALLIALKPRLSVPVFAIWVMITLANFGNIIPSRFFLLNFLFNHYNYEFLLGCLVAYIVTTRPIRQSGIFLYIGLIVSLSLWIASVYGIFPNTGLPRVLGFGTAFALVVMGASSLDINNKPRLPKWALLVGDASYSIYLLHYPLLSLLFKVAAHFSASSTVGRHLISTGCVVVAVGIGCLFHLLIEKPSLSFLHKHFVSGRRTQEQTPLLYN